MSSAPIKERNSSICRSCSCFLQCCMDRHGCYVDGTGADVFLSYVTTSVGSPMGVAAWHAPRCVSPEQNTETPRKLRRGCGGGGAGLHWRRYPPGSSCVCLRTADRFSWREDGKGERGERAHNRQRAAGRDSQQLTRSWTTDTTEQRPWPGKAHEGGAVLSFYLVCGGGLLWLLLSGGRRESVYPPIVRVS